MRRRHSLITKAAAIQPSADLLLLQGDARLAAGKKAEALAAYQQVIQARTAAGQKPEEGLYKRAVQAAYDARLAVGGRYRVAVGERPIRTRKAGEIRSPSIATRQSRISRERSTCCA